MKNSLVLSALLTAGNVLAQPNTPVKNVVIVHGAFADGSGWENVYTILKGHGYNVTMVQKTKPSYAIVATDDKSINPSLQRMMYKRNGAVVTEVKGSHVLFISNAAAVAKVIEAAAKGQK